MALFRRVVVAANMCPTTWRYLNRLDLREEGGDGVLMEHVRNRMTWRVIGGARKYGVGLKGYFVRDIRGGHVSKKYLRKG